MASKTAIQLARICAYSTIVPEWDLFVTLMTPQVALVARRFGAMWGDGSPETVREIVQDVFLKLCQNERRILRELDDNVDSLEKLLRVITICAAASHFRRIHTAKRDYDRTVSLDAAKAGFEVCDKTATDAIEWPIVKRQLDEILLLYPREVSQRDRTLFWLYYHQGLTCAAIAQIPGMKLNRKGVESALLRMNKLLREVIQNGKPKRKITKQTQKEQKKKGFPQVIAINSMKGRSL